MKMKQIPDDAIVRLIDLPPGIGGAIMEDEDGFTSIYVNARHGHYARLDDLEHELIHLENDDLHNDDLIEVVEARADGIPAELRSIPRLMKARDLLPTPQRLPNAAPQPVQEKVTAQCTDNRSRRQFRLSPYQASVLCRAINDIDTWLSKETVY